MAWLGEGENMKTSSSPHPTAGSRFEAILEAKHSYECHFEVYYRYLMLSIAILGIIITIIIQRPPVYQAQRQHLALAVQELPQ